MENQIMTKPTYDRTQIIFSLNSLANAPSNHIGAIKKLEKIAEDTILETLSNETVIELIGEWELVWGPIVYQNNPKALIKVADNAMYIVKRKKVTSDLDCKKEPIPDYVVAISGTNPISIYGWKFEDFMLDPMEEWTFGANSEEKGKISSGTMTGLNHLLEMKNNSKETIIEYLKQQIKAAGSEKLLIAVTGHSLGGALSPALALYLYNMQGIDDNWDPKSNSSIIVVPSAGGTSGNQEWAKYYDSKLKGDKKEDPTVKYKTMRIWNIKDIVPHAWELDMLKEIPTLYEPIIPESSFTKVAVKLAERNSIAAGNMHQICDDVVGLPGTIHLDTIMDILIIIEMLETWNANKLIDDIAKELNFEVKLIKDFIDELIKHLKNKHKMEDSISISALYSLKLDSKTKLLKTSAKLHNSVSNFIDFMIQAVFQHIKAYPELLGTTKFADIVDKIKKK